MLVVSMVPVTAQAWTKGAIDAPKIFSNFYSRAIAIDNSGNPHIAFTQYTDETHSNRRQRLEP